MSKIQAMFSAKGRRLFDSERREIDEFNAEYAGDTGPAVVIQRPPVEENRRRVFTSGDFVKVKLYDSGVVYVQAKTHDTDREVKAPPGAKLLPARIVVYTDAQSGRPVKVLRSRREKKDTDFGQPMGEQRVTP
jgi:hypothetical protein